MASDKHHLCTMYRCNGHQKKNSRCGQFLASVLNYYCTFNFTPTSAFILTRDSIFIYSTGWSDYFTCPASANRLSNSIGQIYICKFFNLRFICFKVNCCFFGWDLYAQTSMSMCMFCVIVMLVQYEYSSSKWNIPYYSVYT